VSGKWSCKHLVKMRFQVSNKIVDFISYYKKTKSILSKTGLAIPEFFFYPVAFDDYWGFFALDPN